MIVSSQSYQSLWRQVEDAQRRDLPQTAITSLQKIQSQATRERAYGQLLKSALLCARLQAEVSPDSLQPAISRLRQKEADTQDAVLKAVCCAVLSSIYDENHQIADQWESLRDEYRRRALSQPDLLAAVRVEDFEPFIVKGRDSELYGHDLLSVVGAELGAWDLLASYYRQAGNRRAACLTALNTVRSVQDADSLIAAYGDLPEAGEVAIRRYELMRIDRYTAAERHEWLRQSLLRWGSWKRANTLRNYLTELTNPNFLLTVVNQVGEVGKPQTVRLTRLRHLRKLTLRVYRTGLQGDTSLNPADVNDYQKMRQGLTALPELTRTLTFSAHPDYELFEDSVELAGLPAGVYLLEADTEPHTLVSRSLYFVSGLRVLSQTLPNESRRFVVVDATTGQPVAGAKLRLRSKRGADGKSETLTCDRKGEAVWSGTDRLQSRYYYAFTADDTASPEYNSYGSYSYYERQQVERTSLFTDRAIYRPGQTVYATAIVWREVSPVDHQAVADKSVTFELRDANYKLVGEQRATTDRFGKCAVQFTLPTGLLNGSFTVRANNGSRSLRVEEYKRPTFRVDFADYKQSYQPGDTVRAEAKAVSYAGVPVQGARVRYKVVRRVAYWWLSYSSYWQWGMAGRGTQDEVLCEGETATADDGAFAVDMPLTMPQEAGLGAMFYNFVVEADVTDVAGETHSGTLSLPLGNRPTALTVELPRQVRRDQLPQLTFTRRNAAGKEIDGTVRYRLDNGRWHETPANVQCSIFNAPCKSGEHRLEAVCESDTLSQTFVVFALDDQRPATPTGDWFYVSHEEFPADGSPVTLQVGASDPDLHIVYGLFAGDTLLESGTVSRNASLVNRQFRYQESYGNGLLLTYAWVKNGECHRHQAFIRRPMPDRRLTMRWETFRDRLTPGQQEEWRLTITQPDGTPADASLLCVLYDKSLDAIAPHSWAFQPVSALSQPYAVWTWLTSGAVCLLGAVDYSPLTVPPLDFSRFDHSVYPYYIYPRPVMVRGAARREKAAIGARGILNTKMAKAAPTAVNDVAGRDEAMEESIVVGYGSSADEPATQETAEVSLRENLNATAFCYPALVTDAQGGVTLRFTLPESLTTWRFMGISNTADMCYGSIDGEAVATKAFMVQPNMPRFIRQGDEAVITARIVNTADQPVKGNALLRLADADGTNDGELSLSEPFDVAAGQTTTVSFQLPASGLRASLYVCKVSATGVTPSNDGFSDGEQHYLPVLPDREYVTRTVPYTQHEPGVKTIDLTTLFPQGSTQHRLTMEYTNNPVWLAVQSLPVLGQPSEQCAIDLAASYYSNLLGKTLIDQIPQAKALFEQWKREEAYPSPLTSHLSQNQELKDMLLSETPWVADADRESEQKQRLADFFDENTMSHRLQTTADKLAKLQNADGSFSWFPGMEGSTTITVAVEEMLTRLKLQAGESADIATMRSRAFDYIGRQMTDLVERMRQEEKKGRRQTFPSFTALRWLYLCAIDGRSLPSQVQSANDYLIRLLKKDIKRQTIYEKALTAIVLARHQERSKAAEYVRSLKEYTVYSEEMGRYYDTPRAAYSWYDYRIPTEVAAIEAILTVTPADQQTVDEMRRWLLQEKRTQQWTTPINSVNAIWALLNHSGSRGAITLAVPQGDETRLAIDGVAVETPRATAGLGYVKATVSEPVGKTFTATKTSEGTSWGAVYAQFLQRTSDVVASQSGITVTREVIMRGNGQSQPLPLTSHLSVGDRVTVRIILDATRDLDFVQVIDRRAACMEPVHQLSGYHNGAYVSPKDHATHYFYRKLSKGRHVIETEYYIDRAGRYETGTCVAGCAYAPEYRGTAPSVTLTINR